MFYSQFILAKKGPLGTIWIAAHLERKLRKNQVADTDIGVSVDSILSPDVPIALRLSSHLLLGVVRIYSRKVNYLFDDCSEALLKIKQAFRSTAVDLAPEESTAPYHSITLPETFDLDDFELPDNEILQGNYVDHHISTREQITLQDTMEGVVYSTSQFGLDERFGDGDASQIGLDLDEELFVNNIAAPGRDGVNLSTDFQASVQPTTPLKIDEINEGTTETSDAMLEDGSRNQMQGLAANTDVDFADPPATPGLVGEPELVNLQEARGSDDYLASAHNSAGLVVEENMENAISNADRHLEDANAVSCSMCSNRTPDHVPATPAEEKQEFKQLKPQEDSTDPADTIKNISTDDAFIQPLACYNHAKQAKGGAEIQHDGAQSNNKTNVSLTDLAHTEGEECQGDKLGETVASPVDCCEAPVIKPCYDAESTRDKYDPSDSLQPVSEVLEFGVENTSSIKSGAAEAKEAQAEACEESKDVKIIGPEELSSSSLLPCSSHLKEPYMLSQGAECLVVVPDLPSEVDGRCSLEAVDEKLTNASALPEVQGEGCQAADFMLRTSEGNMTLEPSSCEDIQAGSSKLDERLDNDLPGDAQLEDLDKSTDPDFPVPEKVLYVPDGPRNLANNLLMESTADKEVQVGDERDGTSISGKKRSFSESSLTLDTHNSVDSFNLLQSKRTAESIPDDDDLLSSILVGRRSSVLKLKPTPPPEVAPMKRLRSGPRVGASKRKVLMDDSMILHGDTIRQQLTSTEDIRRVRKKAPCTRPEIWMIQKQFLDDDIFSEPIFTGMSIELIFLHNQAHDLSGIKVSEANGTNASVEEATRVMDVPMRLDVTEGAEVDGNSGVSIVRNDKETSPAEASLQHQNQQPEERFDDAQAKTSIDAPELRTSQSEAPHEMETDTASIAAPDAVGHDVILGGEFPSPMGPFSRDACNMTADPEVQSTVLEQSGHTEASLQVDVAKLDEQSIDKDAPTVDANDNNIGELSLDDIDGGRSTEDGACFHVNCASTSNLTGPIGVTDDLLKENEKDELGVISEKIVLDGELDNEYKSRGFSNTEVEEAKLDVSYSAELEADIKNACCTEAEKQKIMDVENLEFDHHAELENMVAGHDTEFLNVDDDDAAEDENCMPSAEEAQFLENSGWSSRTRAVAKYLQTLFDREAVYGKKVLPMDNLLVGKTRKEASRMFFETLVLKTRDYIQVEQIKPVENINIKPRMKLMKSNF